MIDEFKPYPDYKDSGLPWGGRIPAHWRLATLRRVADIQLSNVDKHTIQGEQPVRLCNYTDVYYHRYITPDMDFMKATALPREVEKFELRQGDVLVTKDSEDWEDIAVPALVIANMPGVLCGYHLAHIRPDQAQLYGGYLMWACRSEPVAMQFRVAASGVTRYAVSGPDIKGSVLPLPPIGEQDAIGRYLRENEKKVRRFIRNRRRLIEVLNEQKQAIINRAVTRGLDPNAPLKPSGIDWLGDIPEHWEVRRVRNLVRRIDQGVSPQAENLLADDGAYGVLKSGCVNHGIFRPEQHKRLPKGFRFDPMIVVSPGDILVSRACGSPQLVGSVGQVTSSPYRLILSDKTFRLIFRSSAHVSFFLYVMNSPVYRRQVRLAISGAEGLANNLPLSSLRNFLIPYPPVDEAQQVADAIRRECSDALRGITVAQREIELVNEYRTRLIADVVTGKVDVRHLAPPPGSDELEETIDELEPLDDAEGELDEDALAGEVAHADD